MDWFKCINNFNADAEDMWDAKDEVLIKWETSWKDKDKLESYLADIYKDLSSGQRKGKKKYIKRFVDEADDFMAQVGNGIFRSSSKEYQDETIQSLQEAWSKACAVYFDNKEGAAIFTRSSRNKNAQSVREIIPMGPWIFWGQDDWDDIVYENKKWSRLKKRAALTGVSFVEDTLEIPLSHKDRGRKKRRSDQEEGDKSRSRSRSRTSATAPSRSRRNHNDKTSSSSNTNQNQSPDAADSDASTV